MSATVAAALKRLTVKLLTDKRVFKIAGGIVLGIIVIIVMPIIVLLGIFGGGVEIDTDRLHGMIAEQQSASTDRWAEAESAMADAGYSGLRIQEAKALYTFVLYAYASESDFADKLVGCFAAEQTDEELISAVNRTFGTEIAAEDFTNAVAGIRAAYIDTSGYTDPDTKNNLDLVQWAIYAQENGWGCVLGTYGEVLDDNLFENKKNQYPDEVGNMAAFIEENWLGRRTADDVGLIKGYGWFDPGTGKLIRSCNGMPDIGADEMYENAAEKGTVDTIPETPGLVVWYEGHIGIYIGNGEVIYAAGTAEGVVRTALDAGEWTHWLEIPYIEYVGEVDEQEEETQ